MADTTLTAPASDQQALSTSYLGAGNRFVIRGSKVAVHLSDASIGYSVKLVAPNGSASTSDYIEAVPAGGTWYMDLQRGRGWDLDLKSDSGTPTAYIAVS